MNALFSKGAALSYNLRQLKYLPLAIKHRFQRAVRGWADCDCWDIDAYFMEVMPQMLSYLKDNHSGYIGTDEVPTPEAWEAVLAHMIFLLNEMNEDTCSQRNEPWDAYWDSGCASELDHDAFARRSNEIWEYRDKCKDEFFGLFAKYFYDLWD